MASENLSSGEADRSSTEAALRKAETEIARIAAMSPEEVADYLQGAIDEGEARVEERAEATAASKEWRRREN
jgi:hypothetical protein